MMNLFNVSQEWLGMKQVLKIDKQFDKLVFNNKEFVEDIRPYTLSMPKWYWINHIMLIIKYNYFSAIVTNTRIFYIGQTPNFLSSDWGLISECQSMIGTIVMTLQNCKEN